MTNTHTSPPRGTITQSRVNQNVPETPRHRKNAKKSTSSPAQPPKLRTGLKEKLPRAHDLDRLGVSLKTALKLDFEPELWQIHTVHKILQGYDVIAIAGTGYGKSLIFEGVAMLGRKLVIVICPLKALEYDQVSKAAAKGLDALVINEDTESTAELWTRLRKTAQMVYMSPEMAKSPRFSELWKDYKFRERLGTMFVDEAHCIQEYGNEDFRPVYRELHTLRTYTGFEIGIVACTATCTTSTFKVIWDCLGYGNRPFWGIDVGCDRSNLFYHVRVLQNPKNPLFDILHLLPANLTADSKLEDIQKGILYLDSEHKCTELAAAIKKVLPAHLRDCVHSYSSIKSDKAKKQMWDRLAEGTIRILCATDAAGMGCSVSDIQFIVIFACPRSLSVVSQRWGRAGRDRGMKEATCLLLVPPWAFEPEPASSLNALPAMVRVTKKKLELKQWTINRAKMESDLCAFVNIASDECCHTFLRDIFRPDTELNTYTVLDYLQLQPIKRGRRSKECDFETTWIVLDLGRIPSKQRCCYHCNPLIALIYQSSNKRDPRLTAFASEFIQPLVLPPSRPSSPVESITSDSSSFEPVRVKDGKVKVEETALKMLKNRLETWCKDKHKVLDLGDFISFHALLPPDLMDVLLKNAYKLFQVQEITRRSILKLSSLDTLDEDDWPDMVNLFSGWREETLAAGTVQIPQQLPATQRTPSSQHRPEKRARTGTISEQPPLPAPRLPRPITPTPVRNHQSPTMFPASQLRSTGTTSQNAVWILNTPGPSNLTLSDNLRPSAVQVPAYPPITHHSNPNYTSRANHHPTLHTTAMSTSSQYNHHTSPHRVLAPVPSYPSPGEAASIIHQIVHTPTPNPSGTQRYRCPLVSRSTTPSSQSFNPYTQYPYYAPSPLSHQCPPYNTNLPAPSASPSVSQASPAVFHNYSPQMYYNKYSNN